MSDRNLARRATAKIYFDGTDITEDIMPYLVSLSYTDKEEDETDDLSIVLQDREGIWLSSWLAHALGASASNRKISASIIRQNYNGDGSDTELPCGEFGLDAADVTAPPLTVTMRATSIPYDSSIRQTKKNKAWEAYSLSGIANEMASSAGLVVNFQSGVDPSYERVEQFEESDIAFLENLCHNAGLSLKATDKQIVIFGQSEFEGHGAIASSTYGDGSYTRVKLSTGEADVRYSACEVKYTQPDGSVVTATTSDPNALNGQTYYATAKCSSVGEAKDLSVSLLRLKNKFGTTADLTLPGNPALCAGLTYELSGFGLWDGKYIIARAVHTINSSGYVTQITLRKGLDI